jgi:excinuclease UvrABC nuclease subunit
MDLTTVLKISAIKQLDFEPADMRITDTGGGIYRMYDEKGDIVYVGKSQNLHRRLLQHLGHNTNSADFIDEVKFVEWHKVPSPIFQTMLEGIFIALHEPKHNDEVKDAREA